MKKALVFFAVLFFMAHLVFAKVYTISVADNSFTPSSFTARPGDTIIWKWAGGMHTTTSATIPPGATTWNSNITPGNSSFTYVPTITGTYNYQCTIAGMTDRFIIASKSGKTGTGSASIISVYPNPASNVLHIKFNLKQMNSSSLPVSVIMVDYTGKTWVKRTFKVLTDRTIDLQNIPNGTYSLNATQGDNSFNQQIIIKH